MEWQRRKEKERQEVNKVYEMWKGMSEEEMIEILKKNEETEDKAEMRKERMRRKRMDWKEWRGEMKKKRSWPVRKEDKWRNSEKEP